MLVGEGGGHPATGGALQEGQLEEVGLVDIHDGVGLFTDGGGNGLQPHRATVKLGNNGIEQLVVHFVQADVVNLQLGQGISDHVPGGNALGLDLGIVAHPLEQAVGHPRCAPRPAGDFPKSLKFRFHLQNPGGTLEDDFNGLLVVEVQAVDRAKTVAQGRAEQGIAGGRPDEGEGW